MATTKAGYFIDEMRDWKRTISFHRDEIFGLTGKLAEVIQRNSIPKMAAKVEKHQHKLNSTSAKFHQLQTQFHRQESMLKPDSQLLDDSEIKAETEDYQKDLRQKLHDTEKEFVDIKNDCQSFLAGIHSK